MTKIEFIEMDIPGAWLLKPRHLVDERGHFFRAWCAREFEDHGIGFAPLQANMGYSKLKGTIRGMHYQVAPAHEAKLVRCTRGAIFDVVVDLRLGTPSYGKWRGVELTADNGWMLYVPEQCAHGYQTLEDGTEMHYMASQFYSPSAVRGARFDDPVFGIKWPMTATVISEQDRNWPLIRPQEVK